MAAPRVIGYASVPRPAHVLRATLRLSLIQAAVAVVAAAPTTTTSTTTSASATAPRIVRALRYEVCIVGEHAPLNVDRRREVPLCAERLVKLVAPRIEGALYHSKSQRYTFPLSSHASLASALVSPRSVLPPFAQLYAETPLQPPTTLAVMRRDPHESVAQHTQRIHDALNELHRIEYEQLARCEITVQALDGTCGSAAGGAHSIGGGGGTPATAQRLGLYGAAAPLATSAKDALAEAPPRGVPRSLWTMLYPYQRDGVMRILALNGRALLADQMGCGKSKQAIVVAQHYYAVDRRPVLVIVPSSLRPQWRREFELYAPECGYDVVTLLDGRGTPSPRGITIATYDLCSSPTMLERLRALRPGTVLLDEAHYVKTHTAKRTRATQLLVGGAARIVAISGTPSMSRPIELWTQLNMIDPHLFPRRDTFGERYCGPKYNQHSKQIEYRGKSNIEELSLLLRNTVMVRRLKRDVCDQLPPKLRERVLLELGDQKKTQVAALKAGLDYVRKNGTKGQQDAAFMNAVRQTALAKLDAIKRYYDEVVVPYIDEESDDGAPPRKVIVFAHHLEALDAAETHLRSRKIATMRIDGSTSSADRDKAMLAFQNPRSPIRVAILSIMAAGVGLTLTAASLVLFQELAWTPATLMQCEDRAHRIGATEPVVVRYLVALGTTDEAIWSIVSNKFVTMSNLLDGTQERMLSKVTHQAPAEKRKAGDDSDDSDELEGAAAKKKAR